MAKPNPKQQLAMKEGKLLFALRPLPLFFSNVPFVVSQALQRAPQSKNRIASPPAAKGSAWAELTWAVRDSLLRIMKSAPTREA